MVSIFSPCHYCFRHLPVIVVLFVFTQKKKVVLFVIRIIFMHLEFLGNTVTESRFMYNVIQSFNNICIFCWAPAIYNSWNTFHAKLMLPFFLIRYWHEFNSFQFQLTSHQVNLLQASLWIPNCQNSNAPTYCCHTLNLCTCCLHNLYIFSNRCVFCSISVPG